ncbi:MAG: hypothetical protein CMB99_00305 [Flavobacteriaceae bacterium]|nr:hypothetical protein [Flavobacteriaceae bacterium]|tara:strand:- start:1847 stop:2230 length:384 start_codon:yes stop_codon:yes gene_type:complete
MLSKLIADRVHPEDIAVILGRHPVAVRRKLPKGYNPKPRLDHPFGLTDNTNALRAKLGAIIATMSENGLTREQIGELTGLNKHESYRAERRPFSHDWKLSQIERTLAYGSTGRSRIELLEADAEVET